MSDDYYCYCEGTLGNFDHFEIHWAFVPALCLLGAYCEANDLASQSEIFQQAHDKLAASLQSSPSYEPTPRDRYPWSPQTASNAKVKIPGSSAPPIPTDDPVLAAITTAANRTGRAMHRIASELSDDWFLGQFAVESLEFPRGINYGHKQSLAISLGCPLTDHTSKKKLEKARLVHAHFDAFARMIPDILKAVRSMRELDFDWGSDGEAALALVERLPTALPRSLRKTASNRERSVEILAPEELISGARTPWHVILKEGGDILEFERAPSEFSFDMEPCRQLAAAARFHTAEDAAEYAYSRSIPHFAILEITCALSAAHRSKDAKNNPRFTEPLAIALAPLERFAIEVEIGRRSPPGMLLSGLDLRLFCASNGDRLCAGSHGGAFMPANALLLNDPASLRHCARHILEYTAIGVRCLPESRLPDSGSLSEISRSLGGLAEQPAEPRRNALRI